MINECHIGDCRVTLRALAAAGVKVQMCVTSPPYWGLRDYGIEPVVWGGDPAHAHEWGDELTVHKGGPHGAGVLLEGGRAVVDAQAAMKDYRAGRFCECGAWLGALGLEPDYRDFLAHMVEVFELVREVLVDDGTLWLNMGDSYCTGTGADRHPTTTPGPRVPAGWSNRSQPQRIRAQGALKPKDLCLIPARLAIALQEAGWWVRSDIIWHKPNPMPESITDRPTKAHEYIYLLSKSERYFYDADAIKEPASPDTHARYARGRSDHHKWADGGPGRQTIAQGFEHMRDTAKVPSGWQLGAGAHDTVSHNKGRKGRAPGLHPKAAGVPMGQGVRANESFSRAVVDVVEDRNKRSVWTIPTEAFPDAHFATFPRALVGPCILAGSRPGDVVLDIFMGSGTSAQMSETLGRQWVGCEMNASYLPMQAKRLAQRSLDLGAQS